MSVAKSFFDITTGRSHGVIPASDAIRIILDTGGTLVLERVCDCDPDKECAAATGCGSDYHPRQRNGDALHGQLAGKCHRTLVRAEVGTPDEPWAKATGERIDQVLSTLVGELILGETGVEVTEWEIQPPRDARGARRTDVKHVQFGRIRVPLFACKNEDEIARKLVRIVEATRRGQCDRINAVVVRLPGSDEVGIACLPEKPEPPTGATLTGRRTVGGAPWATVLWTDVAPSALGGNERYGLIRRAIGRVKHDCGLAGLDVPSRVPRLSLLDAGGQELASGQEISWAVTRDDFDLLELEKVVREMAAVAIAAGPATVPELLKVTAVRRAK